jgi:hypothetical protein
MNYDPMEPSREDVKRLLIITLKFEITSREGYDYKREAVLYYSENSKD